MSYSRAGLAQAGVGHRNDIDGLRAIAVLPVVFYHFGIGPFSGGYVGVDIFFVISGFLITSILARELDNNRFSIVRFYERRIRRIYPAALAVVLATLLAAAFLLPATAFKTLSRSVLFYDVYSTNILFWRESGYFDTSAELKPLLHTWSLSVEEQFYIFFPIFLAFCYRLGRNWLLALVLAMTGLSFLLNLYAVYRWPEADFYLIPFRAWELSLGAFLAIAKLDFFDSPRRSTMAGAVGILLIGVSLFAFTDETRFPGAAAAAPCIGAALIIAAGRGRLNLVNAAVGNPIFCYVGLISYSLYLWHWPVLVFARYYTYPGEMSLGHKLAALLAIWILSHLSWKFIETPIRTRTLLPASRSLFGFFAATSVVVLILGGAGYLTNGLPSRMSAEAALLDAGAGDNNPLRSKCHGGEGRAIAIADYCVYGAPNTAPTFALWGDSHGAELAAAIGSALAEPGFALKSFTYSNCPPATDFATVIRPGCRQHNSDVLAYLLAHPEIDTVYLIASYHLYETPRYIAAFEAGYEHVATALSGAGKRVVIIHPVPISEFEYPIPTMAAALAMRHAPLDRMRTTRRWYDQTNARTQAFLAAEFTGGAFHHAHPEDALCTSASCEIAYQGRSLYFDNGHLSMFGARFVVARLRDQLLIPAATHASN